MKTLALLCVCCLFAGCAPGTRVGNQDVPTRTSGYAALYNLMSRNAGVGNLLIFKTVPDAVKQAIDDFAKQCGDAAEQLKQFAEGDKSIDLNAGWLTPIEKQTRDGIESATTTALLTNTGDPFVKHLLLSQISGAEYGSHLARAVAANEDHADRKQYLLKLADQLEQMRQRLLKMVQPAQRAP